MMEAFPQASVPRGHQSNVVEMNSGATTPKDWASGEIDSSNAGICGILLAYCLMFVHHPVLLRSL